MSLSSTTLTTLPQSAATLASRSIVPPCSFNQVNLFGLSAAHGLTRCDGVGVVAAPVAWLAERRRTGPKPNERADDGGALARREPAGAARRAAAGAGDVRAHRRVSSRRSRRVGVGAPSRDAEKVPAGSHARHDRRGGWPDGEGAHGVQEVPAMGNRRCAAARGSLAIVKATAHPRSHSRCCARWPNPCGAQGQVGGRPALVAPTLI